MVHPAYRRLGIGAHLLEAAVGHARDVGFRELGAGADAALQGPACGLLEAAGWAPAGEQQGPGVCGLGCGVRRYALDLTRRPAKKA